MRQSHPNVTAVCCISPDIALVGTDKGTLIAYSLRPPKVKAFQSGKTPDKLKQWNLASRSTWDYFKATDGHSPNASLSTFRIQSVMLSRDHGPGVVICGLQSGRLVVFDTRCGRPLGITKPGAPSTNVGFCGVSPDGVDWGQAVLSCSKRAGVEEELVLLATSARAALDSRRWDGGGRDSRPRPGPGWALGEAGGGGFRVEQSLGYDLCLPVEVEEAIPGQRRVWLSRDVRSYLCSRTQVRLLGTRMVTSSVMIGREEYSVEAVNDDGRSLVLDRGYRGVQVGPRSMQEGEATGVLQALGGEAPLSSEPYFSDLDSDMSDMDELPSNGARFLNDMRPAEEILKLAAHSSGGAMGQGFEPHSVDLAGDESLAREGAGGPNAAGGDRGGNGDGRLGGETGEDAGGSSAAGGGGGCSGDRRFGGEADDNRAAGDANAEDASINDSSGEWDRSWRPNGVRIFAKLKAFFDDRKVNASKSLSVLDMDPFDKGGGGAADNEVEESSDDEDYPMGHDYNNMPSWAYYQVVARARLGLPATAVTCHPRMNFVLVGLLDGTIVVVLPGGGRKTTENKGDAVNATASR